MAALTGTITHISKVGDTQISVSVTVSDGSIKEFALPIDTEKAAIRQVVRDEIKRLNSIEGKVEDLQSLVGTVIS
jgi:hypothetical protein